jgi:hypothetical protein
MTVIDEFTRPTMRETLGTLMSASQCVDIAMTRMRLSGINLTDGEVGRLRRLRLVMGKLDAAALLQSQSRPIDQLVRLRAFASSGILQIRSAPRFKWDPDFSIYDHHAALIGAHYTDLPYAADGIALTCVLTDPNAIRRCARRFEQMWDAGYDVLPVVIEMLEDLIAIPQPA